MGQLEHIEAIEKRLWGAADTLRANSNYASNEYFLPVMGLYSYLNENGRAGFVMSSQASSAGRDEAKVRQKLVETGDVDQMIAIRSNFFYTRTVPCELWFFDKERQLLTADVEQFRANVAQAAKQWDKASDTNAGLNKLVAQFTPLAESSRDLIKQAECGMRSDQTQRERIALGILVQHDGLTARQLADVLELPNAKAVAGWLERLLTWEIVGQSGRTKGTRYFIDPVVLRTLQFPSKTTLARLEPHRLRALIMEDLRRHPGSAYGEIQARIGPEIPGRQVRTQLKTLTDEKSLRSDGEKRGRKYWVT